MPAWVLGPATLLQALLVSQPGGPGQAGTLLPRCQPGGSQAASILMSGKGVGRGSTGLVSGTASHPQRVGLETLEWRVAEVALPQPFRPGLLEWSTFCGSP